MRIKDKYPDELYYLQEIKTSSLEIVGTYCIEQNAGKKILWN